MQGELKSALANYKQAEAIHAALQDESGKAVCLANIGTVHRLRGDIAEARLCHESALALYQKLGDETGLASAYSALGLIDKAEGKLDSAEENQKNSLEINRRLSRRPEMATNFGNLGNIYAFRGDWDRALDMQEQALAIHKQFDHVESIAIDYGNIGNICRNTMRLKEAEAKYLLALDLFEKVGSKAGLADTWLNLGAVRAQQGAFDPALEAFAKARDINRDAGRVKPMQAAQANIELLQAFSGSATQV